ncbi:MAG: alpha-ketoglutarate-dependent taurine dioxygenase [Gammaproteobacteria bacterium]|jgi:alpha-ketoglutarate-dependent taurine dioxygenase
MDSPSEIQIPLKDLLTNPDYYLWRFDGAYAVFARMDRHSYKKSIFTDQRIIVADPKPVKVDLNELAEAFSGQRHQPAQLSYIFHVGHCGSTLLARALDLESKNIVYREPSVLRQLSVLLAENDWANSPPELWTFSLKLATTLLGKSYLKNAPVIIKANVPVNFAIDKLMDSSPNANGLLLYARFDNYLLSILKSDGHRQWVSEVTTTLGSLIEQRIGISQMERRRLSLAQSAASLWLAQLSIYNEVAQKYRNVKTLDCELFFNRPEPVLSATFRLFGNVVSLDEISTIVQSDLFSQHAKLPGQQYDNERRLREKGQLMQSLSGELEEARAWLLAKIENIALPDTLPNPLLGDSPLLLEKRDTEESSPGKAPISSGSHITEQSAHVTPYLCITRDEQNKSLHELSDARIVEGLKQSGAILFRGFGYDIEKFTAFVKRFCTHSVYNPSAGREIVDAVNNIQTVDLGDGAFPLHAELCREPWRPDVCFFTCETAPQLGGETTLCDGVKIVEALDKTVISQLQAQPLVYFHPMLAEECQRWLNTEKPTLTEINNPPENCPFRMAFLDGQLTRIYSTSALHHTMFGKQLAFGNFLLFSRYGLKNKLQPCFLDGTIVPDEVVAPVKQVSDQLTLAHRWQKGDLLMLDNTRFLHGRNPILNIDERRIISYFGYLKFAELDAEERKAIWRQASI